MDHLGDGILQAKKARVNGACKPRKANHLRAECPD
jgi:hypothetical protein